MDLLIEGHMRREYIAKVKQDNIDLIEEQRAK